MEQSKTRLKEKLEEYIKQNSPVTTNQATQYSREIASKNIFVSPNTTAQMLRQIKSVKFESETKTWKTKPEIKVQP